MTHISSPSKPKTINSALRHQCRYDIQFKIIIILITTFHSVRVTNKPQSVSNAADNIPGTHCSYSATGIRNWSTQQTWLDCFSGFVSLAVQRLPKFFIPTFPVPRFLLPRYVIVTSTLNIAFIWASRNSLRLWNCAQHTHSQLTFRRQQGRMWDVLLGGRGRWSSAEGARVEAPKAPSGVGSGRSGGGLLISELKMANFDAFWLLFFSSAAFTTLLAKKSGIIGLRKLVAVKPKPELECYRPWPWPRTPSNWSCRLWPWLCLAKTG